jgi:hypothetical protein
MWCTINRFVIGGLNDIPDVDFIEDGIDWTPFQKAANAANMLSEVTYSGSSRELVK